MKTASVRDIRQNFPRVMAWIEDGEQVAVTRRRRIVARLIPEKPPGEEKRQTLAESAAVRRDKSDWPVMAGADALRVVREASGKW